MVTNENKRGPWSKEEKQFIAEHAAQMGHKEIAAILQRNPEAVAKYIRLNHADSFTEKARSAEYDIQRSPIWGDLEKQFSPEELRMFLYHWGRIISQFKDDVYPTEEMQVVDTIKLELLMNRAVTQQQQIIGDINLTEATLATERQQMDLDVAAISNLERQIGVLRAAQQSLGNEYQEMLKEKNKILKDMKATREARIKHLQDSRHSFLKQMRDIVENKALRERLGADMEKMRLASEVEYERLSEWHKYEDGEVDQPWLTPENVLED